MAMVRRVGRRGFGRAFRGGARKLRPVEWQVFDLPLTVSADSSAVVSVVPLGILRDYTQPTIVRIRGTLTVQVDFATPAGGALFFGMQLVDERAFAAGMGAVPRPFDEGSGQGWIWWDTVAYVMDTALTPAYIDGVNSFSRVIDSRAMRRTEGENETLALVVQNLGLAQVNVRASGRVLIKE